MVNTLRWLIMVLLLLTSPAWATTLEAEVDRTEVELGDVFTLTVTARDLPVTRSLPKPDFSPLKRDFDIVGEENSTQLMVANGAMRKFEQWRLRLTPRHVGTLRIPALTIDQLRTRPISIQVRPASAALQDHPPYFLDNSARPETLYVQQQGLYTLRFYYRGDLIHGAVAPPTFGTAQVLRLANQATYHKLVDGVPYTVFEWRYAFFPTEAGTLTIPPQGFQGQLYLDRRLRQVSAKTRPLSVKVLPIPHAWPDDTPWLPAQSVQMQSRWIGADKPLKAGDTVSVEITVDARGQRAALIPDLPTPTVEGVRLYSEPTRQDNDLRTDGVLGRKVMRWTLLFEKAGTFTLPVLTLHWWDVTARKVRKATLPARTFSVAPTTTGAQLKPVAAKRIPSDAAKKADTHDATLMKWQLATALLGLLALLFLILWWRQKRLHVHHERHSPVPGETTSAGQPSPRVPKDPCGLPPEAFYRLLLQQRPRWPDDGDFITALHALERALLVDRDSAAADRARTTLCRLWKQPPTTADAEAKTTLKPLYPR